jgi:hypothetical protein
MDQVFPIPDSIPVHWLWFQVLLLVTFVLHLILMNLVLGGTLISLWEKLSGKRKQAYSNSLPVLIALAINMGVPPLLFVQVLYGHLFYSSSVTMAVPWILVIPVLILAYYGSYIYVKKHDRAPRWSMAGLILSSLFILYIGFMYVNNSTLTLNPSAMEVHISRPGGMNLNLSDRSLWPRYIHYIVSALAVAYLGISVYTHFQKNIEPELKDELIRSNLKKFAWITLTQFLFGTLFWLTTPRDVWMTFMGKNMVATILMLLSLLMVISMFIMGLRGKLWPVVYHALTVIILMAVMREFMRAAYLADIFKPAGLEVTGSNSPLIAFLVIFIAGIFILYYMVSLAINKNEKS